MDIPRETEIRSVTGVRESSGEVQFHVVLNEDGSVPNINIDNISNGVDHPAIKQFLQSEANRTAPQNACIQTNDYNSLPADLEQKDSPSNIDGQTVESNLEHKVENLETVTFLKPKENEDKYERAQTAALRSDILPTGEKYEPYKGILQSCPNVGASTSDTIRTSVEKKDDETQTNKNEKGVDPEKTKRDLEAAFVAKSNRIKYRKRMPYNYKDQKKRKPILQYKNNKKSRGKTSNAFRDQSGRTLDRKRRHCDTETSDETNDDDQKPNTAVKHELSDPEVEPNAKIELVDPERAVEPIVKVQDLALERQIERFVEIEEIDSDTSNDGVQYFSLDSYQDFNQ